MGKVKVEEKPVTKCTIAYEVGKEEHDITNLDVKPPLIVLDCVHGRRKYQVMYVLPNILSVTLEPK